MLPIANRLTDKPEVIPETESPHYLQESQGRSRRRTLSARSRNFLIGVRKLCATGPHETTPNCTNLVAASNASCRKCWSTRTCKSAASHSKSAGLRPLGVRLPLPAPQIRAQAGRAIAVSAIVLGTVSGRDPGAGTDSSVARSRCCYGASGASRTMMRRKSRETVHAGLSCPTTTATSLAEFIGEVETIVQRWTPHGVDWYISPWFRGQSNIEWDLEPGWYRQAAPGRKKGDAWYSEHNLLLEFKLRAPRYLPAQPATDWH